MPWPLSNLSYSASHARATVGALTVTLVPFNQNISLAIDPVHIDGQDHAAGTQGGSGRRL